MGTCQLIIDFAMLESLHFMNIITCGNRHRRAMSFGVSRVCVSYVPVECYSIATRILPNT